MVAIFAIMYFFMIRPQQKQQKKIREFQNALKEGDNVMVGGRELQDKWSTAIRKFTENTDPDDPEYM